MPNHPSIDKEKIVSTYSKTQYRVLGKHKHSAVKPCHWQIQRLLTGRDNRNCYKGYFGIKSHLCVQNTPALPFCNHQCVFCWRDLEQGAFGPTWLGDVDDPNYLAAEMIRHTKNIITEHITKARSLENLDLMKKILNLLTRSLPSQAPSELSLSLAEISQRIESTMNKTERALLVLKNCEILINPEESKYSLHPRILKEWGPSANIDEIIARDVTTIEDIDRVFAEAKQPRHAAISLAGEPTLYPRLGELVHAFRKRNMSTFIVTNGTHPEVIEQLAHEGNLPTQLYVTVPAPNPTQYLKICRPLEAHTWEKILQTIRLLPSLSCRTVIRITAVKFLNIDASFVDDYVKLINLGIPHFIDIKGFTVEANALEMQNRWKGDHELRDYIPSFEDLLGFAKLLENHGGFEIIQQHIGSRDILLRGSWPKDQSIVIDYTQPDRL